MNVNYTYALVTSNTSATRNRSHAISGGSNATSGTRIVGFTTNVEGSRSRPERDGI